MCVSDWLASLWCVYSSVQSIVSWPSNARCWSATCRPKHSNSSPEWATFWPPTGEAAAAAALAEKDSERIQARLMIHCARLIYLFLRARRESTGGSSDVRDSLRATLAPLPGRQSRLESGLALSKPKLFALLSLRRAWKDLELASSRVFFSPRRRARTTTRSSSTQTAVRVERLIRLAAAGESRLHLSFGQ